MKKTNQSNPIKKERNAKIINGIATFCSMLMAILCCVCFIKYAAYGIQIAMGFIILALSHFFTYGMEIQNDVDGLV